ILVKDDVDIRGFGDVANETDGGLGGAAETQPVMGGHQEDRVSAGFARGDGVVDGFKASLSAYAGNYLERAADAARRLRHELRHSIALGWTKRNDFARVAIAGQAADALDGADLLNVLHETFLVDAFVSVKRTESSWVNA